MMTDREKDRYQVRVMTLFGLVVSVIMGIFALNIYYFREVEKSLAEQTYQDLKRENDQASVYLQGMIRERFEMLEVFSAYRDLPEGTEKEKWQEKTDTLKREGLRFGISDSQGIMYYGNNESRDVSARIDYQRALKGENSVSRLPSEEFNGLYGLGGRKQPEAIARRILNAFHASGTIHASIGITLVGDNETEYDAILRRADQALYQAKRKGKNQFTFQL
ncbi:MAG: diguanylate cyclase [Hungatella sp.]|nr:diguanylate cyclase [Hungatella sp.]